MVLVSWFGLLGRADFDSDYLATSNNVLVTVHFNYFIGLAFDSEAATAVKHDAQVAVADFTSV